MYHLRFWSLIWILTTVTVEYGCRYSTLLILEGISFLLLQQVLISLFSYRQTGDAEEKEENPAVDEMKETPDKEESKESIEGTEKSIEKEENVDGNEMEKAVEGATEQNNKQGVKGDEGIPAEGRKEEAIDVVSKEGGKETTTTEQSLDEEWRNKVDEEILKLRSTLKEKLSKFGFNPEGELW